MKSHAPYGDWPSPVSLELIAGGAVFLLLVDLDDQHVYWAELRPQEQGRVALLQADLAGTRRRELTPRGLNVRSKVHEYGGGAARARGDQAFVVDFADQQIWALQAGARAADPRPLLCSPGDSYGDLELGPDGCWLAAVRERSRPGKPPEDQLVLIPTAGSGPQVVATGHDFFSSPRFSPDGRQLAYLSWDHPDMPWDSTTLWVKPLQHPDAAPRAVAGGADESVSQPLWSPEGILTFCSDRSGFWNLYQEREGRQVALAPAALEFSRPGWTLGLQTYGFVHERLVLAAVTEQGIDRLVLVDLDSGSISSWQTAYVSIDAVQVCGGKVAFTGATHDQLQALVVGDVMSGDCQVIARAAAVTLEPGDVSVAEPITYDSEGRETYAFFYPPQSARCQGPAGGLPPLIVQGHGGPTACCSAGLRLATQFWTSRGFAVVDVNYGGSSGYGRAYRERLRRNWGVVDLQDCLNAARQLVAAGKVDGAKLFIRGGSAGGYTTLCALTFSDLFAGGASYFGVGDLELLAQETHKFEAHYLDGLVGPLPEARALYRQRSPLAHLERLATPLIVLQGLADKVVPPRQAQKLVAALAAQGVTHAYVEFADEGHGFRKKENIKRMFSAELAFYRHLLGLPPAPGAKLEIRHP